MKRVDFLVFDTPSPAVAAEVAADHGWIALSPSPRVLQCLPTTDSALELRNRNAPVDLVLVVSQAPLRAIGVHDRGTRIGAPAQLRIDDEEFEAIVEDAPVVEHLVELLATELSRAGRPD